MVVESTWNEREIPLLEAVYAAEERGERPAGADLAVVLGVTPEVAGRAVASLVDGGFLDGLESTGLGDMFPRYLALRLLERGRRAIGQWPPAASDAFVTALDRLIAAESDPDERSRLVRLRDAAGDVGKQTLAGAIVAAAQITLG